MAAKKNRDIMASLNDSDRSFTRIYPGLIRSRAYHSLSLGAKQFYLLCRVQACSKEGRAVLYRHGKEFGVEYDTNCFVFPASHLETFGIRRQNSTKYFHELEEKGFVDRVENNKHMKKVNVYRFSARWKLFHCESVR